MPDMFTEGDRSIRKIPITTSHRTVSIHQAEGVASVYPKKQKNSFFFWGLITILICALAGLLLSTLFEKAHVSIVLKTQVVDLPSHIIASQDPSQDGLPYTLVLVKSIPAGFLPIQGSLAGGQIAVINPSDLAKAVAQQMVSKYAGEPIAFSDPSMITLSVATNTPTFGHMMLTVTGSSTSLLWHVDAEALQKALLGTNRSDFESVVKTFGAGIAEAHLSMRPFWKTTLPNDENKLVVSVVQP